MKPSLLLLFSCFLFPFISFSQQRQTIVVDEGFPEGYYIAVTPATKAKAVLVLLDGFAGNPESVLKESKLPAQAVANGIITIVMAMGPKIYSDSVVTGKITMLLNDVMQRFKVSPQKFAIGGFSAGGTIALRYAELCHASPGSFPILPGAVFAVDSPVDIIDLWDFFERQIERNASDAAVNESNYVTAIMEKEYGRPDQNLDTYKALTPFYKADNVQGNEVFLKDIAVRTYHDVDIPWRLKNRRQSAFDSNFLNASEMILRLMAEGNTRAEFIQGRKGMRLDGTRHPHSWNIVDETECIRWILKSLN
ncbi:MAG: hypothetical protein EOO09_10130 [Chitinophagaceae bacterium]|nr:MAG: hypothetical protein EOO09_10130 [Chitinophagaceae bacterium]